MPPRLYVKLRVAWSPVAYYIWIVVGQKPWSHYLPQHENMTAMLLRRMSCLLLTLERDATLGGKLVFSNQQDQINLTPDQPAGPDNPTQDQPHTK